MKILLDTHAFLWFIAGNLKLSKSARSLIEDTNNKRLVSKASLWEMAIKVSIGKLVLQEPFEKLISSQMRINDMATCDIEISHFVKVSKLPFHHRDPFDRLIISQSLVEDIPVITVDGIFVIVHLFLNLVHRVRSMKGGGGVGVIR